MMCSLESLTLTNFGLDDDDMQIIATALSGNSRLEILTLDGNHIGDQGVQCLVASWKETSALQQLTELSLRNNNYGVVALNIIINALFAYPSLTFLDLSRNVKVGDEMARNGLGAVQVPESTAFAVIKLESLLLLDCNIQALPNELLCHLRNLRNLSLKSNRTFEDTGAISLAESLLSGSLNKLEALELIVCGIGAAGAHALVKASCTHPSLKHLELHGCEPCIEYRQLPMIANDLTHSKLSKLSLHATILPTWAVDRLDAESQATVKAQKEVASQALLRAVKCNMHLKELSKFDIPDIIQKQVRFYLNLNKFGRKFLLSQEQEVIPALWSHILEICGEDASFLFYFLQEQPTLIPAVGGKKRRIPHAIAALSSYKR
jgi:hypothetical protein